MCDNLEVDNLTHSLAGFASVELLNVIKPQTHRRVYLGAHLVALLTNNLPDLDFVYSGIIKGRLGYLLHHRGHTHTFPFAFLLSALVALGAIFWLQRGGRTLSRTDKLALFTVAFVGGALHLFLDGWNIYGIHPFWPIDNRWFYGDSIFIIEPFLWGVVLPLVALSCLPRGVRFAALAVLGLYYYLIWITGYLLGGASVLLTLLPVLIWGLNHGLGYRRVFILVLAVTGIGLAGYFSLSGYLKSQLVAEFGTQGERELDVMLSPLPANPFCWTVVVSFETKDGATLGLRRGLMAPFPGIVATDACPRLRRSGSTAPLQPLSSAHPRQMLWMGELRYSRLAFSQLAADNCIFGAFLRFSRAPFFIREGDELIIGDLRFDWETELSFAELKIPLHPGTCPQFLPPWIPPRRQWLVEK